MYIIGITGKTGSGKSIFSNALLEYFQKNEKKAFKIDIDKIGHSVVQNDKGVKEALIKEFGNKILDDTNNVSRKKLSDLVFSNSEALNLLNLHTLHAMCEKIDETICTLSGVEFLILDYALLPKIDNYFNMCNYKILIESDIQKRKGRILQRDKITEEKFLKRENSTITYCNSDYDIVIKNESTLEDFFYFSHAVGFNIMMQNKNKKIAYYPGSFDPITYGHMNIIEKGLKLGFDEIIVAVTANSSKKKTMFTLQERYNMICDLYKYNNKVKVILVESGNASVKIAEKYNCKAMIRGLRNVTDFEYELDLSKVNSTISNVETLFLTAEHKYDFISSSTTRELAYLDEDISFYVPPIIEENVKEVLKKIKKQTK